MTQTNGNGNGRPSALQRRQSIVDLYARGLSVTEVAQVLQVSHTTINRHLRAAGVPRRHPVADLAPAWRGRRAPYWELHCWGGATEVVLGRKFCAGCGRWRPLSDYAPDARRPTRLLARCGGCMQHAISYRRAHMSDDRRALDREAQRFREEARRRRNGAEPRTFKNRATVIDTVERVLLPAAPLVTRLEALSDQELTKLAERAGVNPRALYRYRYGESARVRIDVGDRLAVALGTTSSLIWPEQW